MNSIVIDFLLIGLLLTNLRLLNTSRIQVMIFSVALQGFMIGFLPLALYGERSTISLLLISFLMMGIKGIVLPKLLNRTLRQAGVVKEVEPFVNPTLSLLIGLFLLAISYWVVHTLRVTSFADFSLVPVFSMFTVFNGLFLIVSRKKAITQVIGYLTMENGVHAFGASLAIEHPLLVQLGFLLDIWVGVFIMGIAIYHINQEFDHIDTDKLSALKD